MSRKRKTRQSKAALKGRDERPFASLDEGRFLPLSKKAASQRGWDVLDFVYVCGDAYVDHPSFGSAIITRVLESRGYKIGIIAQPDWKDVDSVKVFGKPRLGFFVSSGNMDSMVNHYTVAKRRRDRDSYSPGGKMGLRPDRACTVYSQLIRRAYKDSPIILGGIEASLRRLAHYDYWSDRLKRSILIDSGADLVSYGMGERSVVEIADALASGLSISDVTFIDGTVCKVKSLEHIVDYVELPAWDTLSDGAEGAGPKDPSEAAKRAYATSFAIQYENSDPISAKRLVEQYDDHLFVVANPPSKPLSTNELDAVYRLPFARASHPVYEKDGGIPALAEVKFSLTSNRGCFGECAFCALTFHQGRIVTSRSHESITDEAKCFTHDPDFKGYIHDVGGPTADFRFPACDAQLMRGSCKNKRCLSPKPCKKLNVDHRDYVFLLRELRDLEGVKKVFIRSGIRFDYAMLDKDRTFLEELIFHHVSGQLRVAPEHIAEDVLNCMGKPSKEVFDEFCKTFYEINEKSGKEQYVVAYFMSSHPGSKLEDAIELAEYIRDSGMYPEQVQDFYPTPSTLSTAMYYTGYDPRTMEHVYVAKTGREKAMQRALIRYRDPKNHDLVREALEKAGRRDLIGFGEKCLIKPRCRADLGRKRKSSRSHKASGDSSKFKGKKFTK